MADEEEMAMRDQVCTCVFRCVCSCVCVREMCALIAAAAKAKQMADEEEMAMSDQVCACV